MVLTNSYLCERGRCAITATRVRMEHCHTVWQQTMWAPIQNKLVTSICPQRCLHVSQSYSPKSCYLAPIFRRGLGRQKFSSTFCPQIVSLSDTHSLVQNVQLGACTKIMIGRPSLPRLRCAVHENRALSLKLRKKKCGQSYFESKAIRCVACVDLLMLDRKQTFPHNVCLCHKKHSNASPNRGHRT